LWIAAETLRILRARGLDATLTCAGDWPSRMDRTRFIEDFSPELQTSSIRLAGLVNGAEKASLLREAHFLVLPTRYPREGQPLCILEAMSYGVVPVTTDQGAIRDLFEPAEQDRLAVAPHDRPEALAKTIEDLFLTPTAFASTSSACLETHRKRLTSRHSAEALLTAIHKA